MDLPRDRVPPLTATIDLHMHSTASDGRLPPERVVERAHGVGLAAIALTDHDTLAGMPAAMAAGERLGVRVIGGCEFSTAAPWGEMHVLGYFLPPASPALEAFLERSRADRVRRAREMVARLEALGLNLTFEHVLAEAKGGAVGRPHVARAVVRQGGATDISDVFERFIGRGRPAFVEKRLPQFREVAELVHQVHGVVSVAHLKERGTRTVLERLKEEGLDAVETRHPSHDPDTRARLTDLALQLELLRTGGSDWHGDPDPGDTHAPLGSQEVPLEWLERLDERRARVPAQRVAPSAAPGEMRIV